jgi:hypothetical protein
MGKKSWVATYRGEPFWFEVTIANAGSVGSTADV